MGVMEQSRDSVKLFGKTIQVVPAGSNCSSSSNLEGEHQKNQKPINLENVRQENHQETNDSAQSGRSQQQSQGTANPSSLEMEKEGTSNNNNNSADEKAPKKPVSILPCPRCKSTDTKFCYFNNYNVNQPRYFCRNCQRYWTAGGSMRNVPVGAGRRKNKSSAATNTYPLSAQSAKDQILSFGSSDAKESSNGGSLVTNSSSEEDVVLRYQNQNQNLNQDQNPPIGSPWIYHLNPPPPSAYPISFFPAGAAIHWGYMAPPPPPPPQWVAAAPVNFAPQTSLSLGKKHSRVDVVVDEKRLFVPKTMRIDDPSDAANSSVWLTMGIENRKEDRKFGRGGLFKAFEPKGNQASSAEVLHRNPAAQSRSFLFQEST